MYSTVRDCIYGNIVKTLATLLYRSRTVKVTNLWYVVNAYSIIISGKVSIQVQLRISWLSMSIHEYDPWYINATTTGLDLVSYLYQSEARNYQSQMMGRILNLFYQNRELLLSCSKQLTIFLQFRLDLGWQRDYKSCAVIIA